MLNQSQRTAILELHHKSVGSRRIAHVLKISRSAVKKVIRSQSIVPPLTAGERVADHYNALGLHYVKELAYVLDQRGRVVTGFRLFGLALSPPCQSDHVEPVGELRRQVIVDVGRFAHSGEQKQRRA